MDDDGVDRFPLERMILEALGWDITWSRSILGAAGLLEATEFHALILDQALPFRWADDAEPRQETVWGGCVLLRWLRGATYPNQVAQSPELSELASIQALAENRGLPVLIVSGFYDDELDRETRGTSNQDHRITIAPKPLEVFLLRDYVRGLGS